MTTESSSNRRRRTTTTNKPANNTPSIVEDAGVSDVIVATTEPTIVGLDLSARFAELIASSSVPAERKTGTAENARWFLRKGWIFCAQHPQLDELMKVAQALA